MRRKFYGKNQMKRRKLAVIALLFASMISIAYAYCSELNLLGSNANRIVQELAKNDKFVDSIFREIVNHDEFGTVGMSKVDQAQYKQLIVGGIQSIKLQSFIVPVFNQWGDEILHGKDQLVFNVDTLRIVLGTNLPIDVQTTIEENFLTKQQLVFHVAAYSKPLSIFYKGIFLAPIFWIIWLLVITLNLNLNFREILKNVSWQLAVIGTVLSFIAILVPNFMWLVSNQKESSSYVDIALPVVFSELLYPTLRIGLMMILTSICVSIINVCINFDARREDSNKVPN